LVTQFGACHLSTGEVFRHAAHRGAGGGSSIAAMRRGELMSDEAVIELVRERAHCLTCARGFLLDGYPRTLEQAKSLDALLADLNIDLDAVVHFHAPERVLLERLSGRRVCMACGAGFHLEHRPPSRAGRCDLCGNLLSQREDDKADAVRIRLRSYAATIAPVLDHYRGLGLLHEIDAAARSEAVLARTLVVLDALDREHRS
jgi:adenylate kinase